MRHAKKRKSVNLTQGERKSLILNQCRSLFEHQRIITTYSRAKVVRPTLESVLSLSRVDTLRNRRKVFQILNDHTLVKRVFVQFGPIFKDRNGGFTRILRLKARRGDNASLVIFELTKRLPEKKPPVKEKKEKRQKPTTAQAAPPVPEKEIEKPPVETKEEKHIEKKPKPPIKDTEKEKQAKKPSKFLGTIGRFFKRKQEL